MAVQSCTRRAANSNARAWTSAPAGWRWLRWRAGRVKERVRVHAQLAGFPLLTDAMVVRARQVQNGYLWGLRFLRLDRTTKANLEAFVRQQLANAARLRQAQLYAERMRGMGLPAVNPAAPAPAFAIEATLDQQVPPAEPAGLEPAVRPIEVPEQPDAPPPGRLGPAGGVRR